MQPLNRLQIAWRAAQDIGDGMLVNLGMGMPVTVVDYLRPEADIFIQSENGEKKKKKEKQIEEKVGEKGRSRKWKF